MRPPPLPLLFLLLLCPLCPADETTATIPVTQTWGDLLDTKPLVLTGLPQGAILLQKAPAGPGSSFRLWIGIDRNRVATHGSVVLYCLAEGIRFSGDLSERLGPFQIDVKKVGAPKQAQSLDAEKDILQPVDAKYCFYLKSVPVSAAGDYVVALLRPPGPIMAVDFQVDAKIKVHVSGPGPLPWSPWSEQVDPALTTDPNSDAIGTVVSNPLGGVALPKGSDDGIPLTALPPRAQALPTMNLDQPDPGIRMKFVKDTLIVNLEDAIYDDYPDDDFLTRWWVNDKPFVPDPDKIDPAQARAQAAQARAGGFHQVDFLVDFHPERLGAKKGDRIGVQLLFCQNGWDYVGNGAELAAAQIMEDDPLTVFSRPTRRIDFTYSGNPRAPQQP